MWTDRARLPAAIRIATGGDMRAVKASIATVVTLFMLAGQQAIAAPPSPAAPRTSSVASRRSADAHEPRAGPGLPLDQAAYATAKSDAARRAAGPSPYAKSDFAISATPASRTLAQGGTTTYSVTTAVTSGAARPVALSVSGLPAGVTGAFAPSSVNAGGSSVLTVVASNGAAVGTVGLVITGQYSSPPTKHSTGVSLTVVASATNDFSIAAVPSAQSVVAGGSAAYTVSTGVVSGTAESVGFSVAGLPAGATAAFAPATVTAGQSATLTVATSGPATGTFLLTITGAATGATHSTTVSLTVNAVAGGGGPTVGASWNGTYQGNLAPPDPTGAIGPNSYIELINQRSAIYDRTGALIQDLDLGELARFPVDELTDPQIVWDPTSGRFYYLVVDFYSSAYAFGYSKTSDPHDVAADFCHYSIDQLYTAPYFPDFPKLAVTNDFVLVGANVFLLFLFTGIYQGSDVDWWVKPTDPVCPSSLGSGGKFESVKNADGSLTSTPVPAVAADASSTGWVIGSADVGTGSASFVTVFKVDKNAQGFASLGPGRAVSVDPYAVPANAPQEDAGVLIDTFDTRFGHAVAGFDPRIGTTALWMSHTVFGGAGAEVRWYEIAALATPALSQSGAATDPSLYVFNGAISPDRAADDLTGATGADMVLGFNTSSSTTYPAVAMVSKRGASPQSAPVSVRRSLGPNADFTCVGGATANVCRWGDYAGAMPDPLVSSGGLVWLSAEWNDPATNGQDTVWRTWNWSAYP